MICQRCDNLCKYYPFQGPYWVITSSMIHMEVCRDCMEEARALQRYSKPGHEGSLMIWSPQLGAFV